MRLIQESWGELIIYVATQIATDRKKRGLKLNLQSPSHTLTAVTGSSKNDEPESIARSGSYASRMVYRQTLHERLRIVPASLR